MTGSPLSSAPPLPKDRYAAMFVQLEERGEGALGAFLMLGDPDFETSARLLDALVEGGADMIELGIPFSDPIADGPVIQAAAHRALKAGITPSHCFALIKQFRVRHPFVPIGILTYANLVVARGRDAFYRAAGLAGADSILVADVPALEAKPFADAAHAANVHPVLIAASNTPKRTLRGIADLGRGYTYCVSRFGVTGTNASLQFQHQDMLEVLREAGAAPPILGFGISKPDHAKAAIQEGAAGVIVGSAIVRIAAGGSARRRELRTFLGDLKGATRSR